MRVLFYLILLFAIQSQTTKKYPTIKRLSDEIKSATGSTKYPLSSQDHPRLFPFL